MSYKNIMIIHEKKRRPGRIQKDLGLDFSRKGYESKGMAYRRKPMRVQRASINIACFIVRMSGVPCKQTAFTS